MQIETGQLWYHLCLGSLKDTQTVCVCRFKHLLRVSVLCETYESPYRDCVFVGVCVLVREYVGICVCVFVRMCMRVCLCVRTLVGMFV